MNPLREGLIRYQDLNLPISHVSFGGALPDQEMYVPSGSIPIYKNSTTFRNGRPRGRPRKIQEPEEKKVVD